MVAISKNVVTEMVKDNYISSNEAKQLGLTNEKTTEINDALNGGTLSQEDCSDMLVKQESENYFDNNYYKYEKPAIKATTLKDSKTTKNQEISDKKYNPTSTGIVTGVLSSIGCGLSAHWWFNYINKGAPKSGEKLYFGFLNKDISSSKIKLACVAGATLFGLVCGYLSGKSGCR